MWSTLYVVGAWQTLGDSPLLALGTPLGAVLNTRPRMPTRSRKERLNWVAQVKRWVYRRGATKTCHSISPRLASELRADGEHTIMASDMARPFEISDYNLFGYYGHEVTDVKRGKELHSHLAGGLWMSLMSVRTRTHVFSKHSVNESWYNLNINNWHWGTKFCVMANVCKY